MKKIALTTIIAFAGVYLLLTALEKLLDAEMPEWMREQVNREN